MALAVPRLRERRQSIVSSSESCVLEMKERGLFFNLSNDRSGPAPFVYLMSDFLML